MDEEKKANKNETSSKSDENPNWRKKFTAQVLGNFEFNHRTSEDHFDQEETEKEIDNKIYKRDDLKNELGEYYTDQKKSEHKFLQHYNEIYSQERVLNEIKYRWEFMRRCPEYIDAFEQEKSMNEKEEPSFNLFKRFEYWKSFGLFSSTLPDPNLSFEEIQNRYDVLESPFLGLNFISKNYKSHAGISYFTYLDEKIDFKDYNKLHFIIDFTKVKSIDALQKIMSSLIDDLWSDYCERAGQGEKVREMEEYDLILKVGDLRDKEKLTDQEIAEKISQGSESLEPAIKKVSFYYMRYKQLINGGYRDL